MKSKSYVPFEEQEKSIRATRKRLREQFPMAGNISGEDTLWRSLTADSARDLNPLTQKRMQEIAFYLFDTNPMAHRIIEIMRDFVVGDGFTYTAEDEQVLEIIEEFWEDPDNNMDMTIDENVLELALFGENCLPVWVNPANGAVKLGYVDPANIKRIIKDKNNPRINKKIIWQYQSGKKERELDIIQVDRNPKSETYGKLVGDTFYFAINKPISATRGRSDLLCLADWLDGHDQFLFARLERAFLLNTFIWDIECEGMQKEDLEEFVRSIEMPKSGSIRAHNEKVKWSAVSPKLEADDASNEARLFKNQILGGAGYPEHWFAEGSTTTRATALEMSLPTLKKLKSRQRLVKAYYSSVLNFVIDQAIIAGRLKEDVSRDFKLIPSPITTKDNKGIIDSVKPFFEALQIALQNKWITPEEASSSSKVLLGLIGIEEFTAEKDSPNEDAQEVDPAEDNSSTDPKETNNSQEDSDE